MWLVVAASACGRLSFDALPGTNDGRTADAVDGSPPVPSNVSFAATTATNSSFVSALSLSHTVTSTNAVLLCFVSTRNSSPNAPPTVTGITFGTQAFTKLTSLCPDCGNFGINNFELWVLTAPNVGTSTIDVTLTGQANGASAIVSSYTGVAGYTSGQTSTGASGTVSIAWTNPTDGAWAVVGAMAQGGFALQLNAATNQVSRSDTECDANDYQGSTTADQQGVAALQSVSFDWTIGAGPGPNCLMTPATRAWIALGVSLY